MGFNNLAKYTPWYLCLNMLLQLSITLNVIQRFLVEIFPSDIDI